MARPKKRKGPLMKRKPRGVLQRLGLSPAQGFVPVLEALPKKVRNRMRKYAREAASWPLHEVLISKTWADPEETMKRLVQIVVARRAPWDEIAAGVFIVDLACLGLKNGYVFNGSPAQYRSQLLDRMTRNDTLVPVDLDTAAKVIKEAVAYARSLGFAPHPDAVAAAEILGDADPDRSDAVVPLGGKDGKPFYVSGPDDDAMKVVDHLRTRLGPDGFHFLVAWEAEEWEGEDLYYLEEDFDEDEW